MPPKHVLEQASRRKVFFDSAGAPSQGLTLVHSSAQPEPFMTQNTP